MQRDFAMAGPAGKTGPAEEPYSRRVRWTGSGSVERAVAELAGADSPYAHFADPAFFAESRRGRELCRRLRATGVNILWSARVGRVPGRELLREMRLAGCCRVTVVSSRAPGPAVRERIRAFGLDYAFVRPGGTVHAENGAAYTVAEREAVARRLPELHAAHFELAVACFQARRFQEVMRPLGRAMIRRFPANELCLNLLACLSAARHYPDVAEGLLVQAAYGRPHPVVRRNRERLRSWLADGGDVKGVRLLLEAEGRAAPAG